MALAIPSSLDWMRDDPAGREWLAGLPERLQECVERWSLRVGEPYPGSYVSVVWPVTSGDGSGAGGGAGSGAVLKLQFPDPDSVHEAAALRAWDGAGAIRLLEHDPGRLALLLERCEPGIPLSTVGQAAALEVLAGLIPRLWLPAGAPFATAETEALRWAGELPARWVAAGRPGERRLVDAAAEALRGLATSQGRQVLLNQDLHANNVLRAVREPWLVIDPKPLLGEPELAVAALVRDYGLGHGRAEVRGRLDHLTGALGVDRERARAWSMAYAVVWAFLDLDGRSRHLETAGWLLD